MSRGNALYVCWLIPVPAAVGISHFPRVTVKHRQLEKKDQASGDWSADRRGPLTFEPVTDSTGLGTRVNNGDVAVTSGYKCLEIWWNGGGRGGQDVVINSPGARLGGPTLQLAHDTI